MRRVVVTGMGAITALGSDVESTWQKISHGKSGVKTISKFDPANVTSKIAAEITTDVFDPDAYIGKKERKRMDDFITYALKASEEALLQSGLIDSLSEQQQERAGVLVGSGIGGLVEIQNTAFTLKEKGAKRISPFFIPASLINLASGHISIKYGFQGPNHAVVTACATGTHAIGDAARLIALDDADIMVAGGCEGTICELGIGGFCSARALSTSYNDTPQQASRPWDQGRDGFVMGEGAGIVILEEYEHAKKRGATIYAEVTGYGLSGDAHHITAPHSDGRGARRCMQMALKRAKLNTSDIDYINAHGTSTPLGDIIELNSVKKVFADDARNLLMSSTKSSIGHLLGAAGAIEAVLTIKAMATGIAPPTINLENPDDACEGIDLVANVAKEININHAMSNSFGFGGTNATLIFSKVC